MGDEKPKNKSRFRPPWLKHKAGFVIHHLVMVLILVPLCGAATGAFLEFLVFKDESNPHELVLWMPIAAWIASPFILIRVFWRWPRHVMKVELVIYIVQLAAYFIGVRQTVIIGAEYYTVNSGIRTLFTVDDTGVDRFHGAVSEENVWSWLEHVVDKVYKSDNHRSVSGRILAGNRLMLLTSFRIRQHRVDPVCCSAFYKQVFLQNTIPPRCYPPYEVKHESHTPYGTNNMSFAFYKRSVLSKAGYYIDPYDYTIDGTFSSYPLAGFTTLFPPGIHRQTAVNQLVAMRQGSWIDEQTRAIIVEIALSSPDFLKNPVWAAATFLLERDTIGRFVATQPTVHFNFFTSYFGDLGFNTVGGAPITNCIPNGTDDVTSTEVKPRSRSEVLLTSCPPAPATINLKVLFATIVPISVYTFYMAICGLLTDWKRFLRQPFNWTLEVWMILLMVVVVLTAITARRGRCSASTVEQTPFVGLNASSNDWTLTRFAGYVEFLPSAEILTYIRRLLAISIFLQIFNGLRFLVRFRALGMMVRTLYFSATSLVSFSISFFVIFFGFVLMFHYIFSVDVEGFSDVPRTIITLWLGMLGEVALTAEMYRSRDWAIGLYVLFTFISAFVLLTLIISIVSSAHERAQAEAARHLRLRRRPDQQTEDAADGKTDPTVDRHHDDDADHSDSEFTNLISEGDMLASAVQKWKAATLRSMLRSRPGRIAPHSHSGEDDEAVLTEQAADSSVELNGTGSRSTASLQSARSRQNLYIAESNL